MSIVLIQSCDKVLIIPLLQVIRHPWLVTEFNLMLKLRRIWLQNAYDFKTFKSEAIFFLYNHVCTKTVPKWGPSFGHENSSTLEPFRLNFFLSVQFNMQDYLGKYCTSNASDFKTFKSGAIFSLWVVFSHRQWVMKFTSKFCLLVK